MSFQHFRMFHSAAFVALALALPHAQAQTIPTDDVGITEHIAQALRRELGDGSVAIKNSLTLSLGSMQVNLDRIATFCRKTSGACSREVEQYVKGVAQVVKAQNAPIDPADIRLVIRSSEYIKRAQASLGGDGPALQYKTLVEGLVSVVVLDTPRAIRPLTSQDLKNLNVSEEEIYEVGVRNMQKLLKPLVGVAKPVAAGQIGSLPDSFYDVGRIAMHADWDALAKAQSGTLLIAVPTTDMLLYVSESSPSTIDALRTMAKSISAKAPNPLSAVVLRWTNARWEVVP